MATIHNEISYPENSKLYFYVDKNGVSHWSLNDPASGEDPQEIKLEDEIVNIFGRGSKSNPIVAKMRFGILDRSVPFNINLPGLIRKGGVNRHFVDGEGNNVDVLEVCNPNGNYPFNGVVLDRKGCVIATRTYSGTGQCSDGDEEHTLSAFEGPMEIQRELEPEDVHTEEKAGEEKPSEKNAEASAPKPEKRKK